MAAETQGSVATRYLLDTHTIFWFEQRGAAEVFQQASMGKAMLLLHPIVLAELSYVFRKHNRDAAFARYIEVTRSTGRYEFITISVEDLVVMDALTEIPEMHDRLLAASAIPVVTCDASLTRSNRVRVVW